MYPEYLELLPWVLSSLPSELSESRASPTLANAYSIFYDYVKTLVAYHNDKDVQGIRAHVIRRRAGMKNS